MDGLGQIIRERRKAIGLKVYELAAKVDVDPVYITQIEKHNKKTSIDVFKRIQRVLNLPPECLSLFIEEKYPGVFEGIKKTVKKSDLQSSVTDSFNEYIMQADRKDLGEFVAGLLTYSTTLAPHPKSMKERVTKKATELLQLDAHYEATRNKLIAEISTTLRPKR